MYASRSGEFTTYIHKHVLRPVPREFQGYQLPAAAFVARAFGPSACPPTADALAAACWAPDAAAADALAAAVVRTWGDLDAPREVPPVAARRLARPLPAAAPPLELAARAGCLEAVEALLARGADPDAGGGGPLRAAVEVGDPRIGANVAKALLVCGADPNLSNDDFISATDLCSEIHGQGALLWLLVAYGGDYDPALDTDKAYGSDEYPRAVDGEYM